MKQGGSSGWVVIREGIYMTLTEDRVRRKQGGLAMRKIKQPVLPRWPIGEHWLHWKGWSRLLLAKAVTQAKLAQAKMRFVGSCD